MFSDTTMHVRAPGKAAAYFDWMQMLTGVLLSLFMFSHMTFVSSILFGAGALNTLADFFEKNYMAQIGGPVIGFVFLMHFVLGARKVPFRVEEQRTIWKHARMLSHVDTWLWVVQAVSAMIILILGSIHIWVLLADLPITAAKSATQVQHWTWTLFYFIFLPLVWLHLGIGLYRIGVKWGVIKRSDRKKFVHARNILMIVMIAIGILTIIRFMTLKI